MVVLSHFSLKRTAALVAVAAVASPIFGMLFARGFFSLDINRRVYSSVPGECAISKTFADGLNSIVRVGDYIYFYSTGDNNASTIHAYNDYNKQQFTFQIVTTKNHKLEAYNFEDIATWKDYIYAINYISPHQNNVEVFRVNFQDKILKHVKSLKHDNFYNLVGLAVIGKDAFYVGRQFWSSNFYMKIFQMTIPIKLGSVLYFNGLETIPVITNISTPTGLRLNSKKTRLQVASFGGQFVGNYKIARNWDQLVNINIADLNLSPTSFYKNEGTGEMYITTQPLRLHYLLTYATQSNHTSPSQVISMKWSVQNKQYIIKQIYANDGATISGADKVIKLGETLVISNKKKAIQCVLDII